MAWVAVVGAALLLRIVAMTIAWGRAQTGDSHVYLVLADQLLAGNGFAVLDPFLRREVYAVYPPLFPALLAVIGALLPLTLATIAALNLTISITTSWLVLRVGQEAGEPQAGEIAAMLYLLLPSEIALTPIVHKEGLLCLLLVALALSLLRGARTGSRLAAIGFGTLAGLIGLLQPAVLPLAGIFAIVMAGRFATRRQWLKFSAIATLSTILVLLPWWIRNALLFGRFIPLTNSVGASMWIAADPHGDGLYRPPPHDVLALDEVRASQALVADAVRQIAADPFGFAQRAAIKIGRAMTFDVWAAKKIGWMTPMHRPALLSAWGALSTAIFWALAMFALAGALMRRHSAPTALLFACIAQILLFGPWFEFGERHRYFLNPFLVFSAAVLLVKARNVIVERPRRSSL